MPLLTQRTETRPPCNQHSALPQFGPLQIPELLCLRGWDKGAEIGYIETASAQARRQALFHCDPVGTGDRLWLQGEISREASTSAHDDSQQRDKGGMCDGRCPETGELGHGSRTAVFG